MNRQEVTEQLRPVLGLRARVVEHSPRTRIVMPAEGEVIFNPGDRSRAVAVSAHGLERMSRFAGMGEHLRKDLSERTFGTVLQELLAKREKYALVLQGDTVEDVMPARTVHYLDAERVLSVIERTIGESADYERATILDRQVVHIEVVGDKQEAVVPGDFVNAGAMIAFSPLGTVAPMVQTYVRRLVCSNGAMANTVAESFGFGEGDDAYQWFRRSVRKAYGSVGRVTEQWRRMAAETIEPGERAAALEALVRRARLDPLTAASVRARALEEPPRNSYDMLQLLTWATSHLRMEPRSRVRAMLSAAEFAGEDSHARVCPVCHQQSRRARLAAGNHETHDGTSAA